MPATNPTAIRQASALLAAHLQCRGDNGAERLWLRPGTRLKLLNDREAALLAQVEDDARCCPATRALGTLRDTFVFGTGNPKAELVFVGEAPGAEEEKRGQPFVGPAGELLDRIIKAMGLSRGEVYITNIVKFRPKTGDSPQGSANRKPTATELAAGLPYLQRELAIIRPKIIVALGGAACAGLTGTPDAKVGQMRGKFLDFHGTPLMVTYHPSYLLRQPDPAAERREKRKLWEDMLLVMEKLGLPVSEKQRAYFTK